jgi:hypothetical protein
MSIIDAPEGACPLEVVLEPQRDPLRGAR